MVFIAALVAAILALGTAAGPALATARWTVRHPGTALACWAGVIVGILASVTGLVALALLWPPAPGHGLLERFHSCLADHAHGGLVWASLTSGALIGFCCFRATRVLPRLWRAVSRRRRHMEVLRLVARADDRNADVLVLDHPIPVAYCIPAQGRSIVVSSGARERLDVRQLDAVLAHERTHLRHRHHLVLLLLDLVHALMPRVPTLRRARTSVPALLEMIADDAAARRCGREALAGALRSLQPVVAPAGALAAAGAQERTHRRLARLEASRRPVRGARPLGWVTAAGAAAGPLALVVLAMAAVPLPC
ncbi:M56 family metallopeptidase [Spirillospora sp. CA-294931]|uniref:M56 family metallopeptidase n=1 Tax=Spirillospora sp. CA-294931 TaxID=3240042 RepID=UPI003D8B2719